MTLGLANPPDAATCRATDGRLPPNVQVNRALLRPVRSMLQRSEEFRRQCEELAARPTVYVRVNLSVEGLPSRFCARSVIQRMTDGPLLIFVEIERTVNWAEWLAHEFEHVLEQAEGLRVKDLRNTKRQLGVGRGGLRNLASDFRRPRCARADAAEAAGDGGDQLTCPCRQSTVGANPSPTAQLPAAGHQAKT